MKTFKQRLMLVATLMVIAVSGYAGNKFVNLLEGDNTNFDGGTRGNWNSWGDNTPTWNIIPHYVNFVKFCKSFCQFLIDNRVE